MLDNSLPPAWVMVASMLKDGWHNNQEGFKNSFIVRGCRFLKKNNCNWPVIPDDKRNWPMRWQNFRKCFWCFESLMHWKVKHGKTQESNKTMESVTRTPLEPPGSVTVLQGLLDLCVSDRFVLPTLVYMEEPALDKQTRMGSSASVLMEDEEPSVRKPSPSINPPSPAGWLGTLPSWHIKHLQMLASSLRQNSILQPQSLTR